MTSKKFLEVLLYNVDLCHGTLQYFPKSQTTYILIIYLKHDISWSEFLPMGFLYCFDEQSSTRSSFYGKHFCKQLTASKNDRDGFFS